MRVSERALSRPTHRLCQELEHHGLPLSQGTQPTPWVECLFASVCGQRWSEPSRPQSFCALAEACRAQRSSVPTAAGEGACFGWSCPYVLRSLCHCHLHQPQTHVRIARSGCRRRGACHMPLTGGGTSRIKCAQHIGLNHTIRSVSIRWATVIFRPVQVVCKFLNA